MAKSPVYGLGRNWNHRPKNSKHDPSAANIKMRGKKYKLMSCGCCACIDLRDKLIKQIHTKEIEYR